MKQVEYMYKSDEGELLKLTDYGQRNADTSTHGTHIDWPMYYSPISLTSCLSASSPVCPSNF